MTLWGNLAVGGQALLSFQRGIATVNKNMTNVNTDGYKREIPLFKDVNQGAVFDRAQRIYSQALQSRYVATNQQKNYYEEIDSGLDQIEQIFNDTTGTGFAGALDDFFYAMNDVITSPDNLAARDSFLYTTQTLIGRIRTSYNELQNFKSSNIAKAQNSTTLLNDKLKQFATINKELRYESHALDNDRFNTLKNQQDQLLNDISSMIDVRIRYNQDGTIDLFTAKGHELVLGDKASTVEVKTKSNSFTITDSDNNVSYSYEEQVIHIVVNGVDLTNDFQNGTLGGMIQNDRNVSEAIQRLNTFTYVFANSINNQHQGGNATSYDLNGDPGGPLFTTDNGASAIDASNITLAFDDPALVAAATDPNVAQADNTNMKALEALKDKTFTSLQNQSFNEYYNSSIVAHFGSQRQHIQTLSQEQSALLDGIAQKIDELSGVNLDEELLNLQQLQRSYEASARIITVTDELLQTVMGLIK